MLEICMYVVSIQMQSHMKEAQYLMTCSSCWPVALQVAYSGLVHKQCTTPVVCTDTVHLHRPHAVEAYMVEQWAMQQTTVNRSSYWLSVTAGCCACVGGVYSVLFYPIMSLCCAHANGIRQTSSTV